MKLLFLFILAALFILVLKNKSFYMGDDGLAHKRCSDNTKNCDRTMRLFTSDEIGKPCLKEDGSASHGAVQSDLKNCM